MTGFIWWEEENVVPLQYLNLMINMAKKIKEMKEILPLKAIAGKKNLNIE